MIEILVGLLASWSRLAQASPWRWGLGGVALAILVMWLVASLVRARLELLSDRVAAGPIFAAAGTTVLGVALLWWSVDAVLAVAGQPLLEERMLLLMLPRAGAEALRTMFALAPGGRLMLPGVVHLPLALAGCGALYLTIVLWVGRTLAELTSLEQKPADVLARERAEQQKAIASALKEGRPIPTAEVVSVPLADDRLGRTFKLLGHWTSVEVVEPRFVRWQRPLVVALGTTLLLALPAALGGHLGAPLWAGAAVLLDGLRRNLRTRIGEPPPPQAEAPAAEPAPPQRPPLAALLQSIHQQTGVAAALTAPEAALGAQTAAGTNLEAKRVLDDLRRELELRDGLYLHQGLACDAFAARKNVLCTTPPLSGRSVLADLLAFYALLVDGENVLWVAPDAAAARAAELAFRERAERARWRWNVSMATIAGEAGAIDLARAQPGVCFADPESVHRELCGRQEEWGPWLSSLGLLVLPDVDLHHGPRGGHLAHVLRRLRRAVRRAAPAGTSAGERGERVRVFATAAPHLRDLGRFAERIVGRPFLVLGPEVDGAPRPARATYLLARPRTGTAPSDVHPAVRVFGEALAHGFGAELFGFAGVLAEDDVSRANEVTVGRGVATRGRAGAIAERWGASGEALGGAQVVVARASAALYPALPLLTAHLGYRAVPLPPARVAVLGQGEHVGRAAAPPPKPAPAPASAQAQAQAQANEGADGVEGADVAVASEAEVAAAAAAALAEAAASAGSDSVVVLWQAELDPLATLLASERTSPAHPDLRQGCVLATDASAEAIQRRHLRAALAEATVPIADLSGDFGPALVERELAALRAGASMDERGEPRVGDDDHPPRLIESTRREVDATGAFRDVACAHLASEPDAGRRLSPSTVGDAARVVDGHSGDVLFEVERPRMLCAAYPGRVLVHGGGRYVVLPLDQQHRLDEHVVRCEREERSVTTTPMRTVEITAVERRQGGERRSQARREAPKETSLLREAPRETSLGHEGPQSGERRSPSMHAFGGGTFAFEHRLVDVVERTFGVRRHAPDGRELDATRYVDPIETRYGARAASLSFPAETFGAIDEATLHALAHLYRTTLPAFVLHDEDHDLHVGWQAASDGAPASVSFVDLHPGGVGFADAVTIDVLRAATRWALALCRRCPARCVSASGCAYCLQVRRCHALPEQQHRLDRRGADRVLTVMVGAAAASAFGAERPVETRP